MKFLGIDYGTKRIGIALSDENGTIAFPKEIILTNSEAVSKIGKILKKENITEIVIGESLDFSGVPNPLAEKIKIFTCLLEEVLNVKVHKEKEFLTSVEARKAGNTKASSQTSQSHSRMKKESGGKVDAGAAALILQRFLDRRSRQGRGHNKNIS